MPKLIEATPAHSIVMGTLFLSTQALAEFLQKHEEALEAETLENLHASLGSMASQLDMIAYIEAIPENEQTPQQTALLGKLHEKAIEMIRLVNEALTSFLRPPPALGALHD